MRILIFVFLFILSENISSQRSIDLKGSWVVTSSHTTSDGSNNTSDIEVNPRYLNYTFVGDGLIDIWTSYATNISSARHLKYSVEDSILSFQYGSQYKIERYDKLEMILVKLKGGEIGMESVTYRFIPKQVYLNNLPLNEEHIVSIGGEKAYLASKKLYPNFINNEYPDFHLYMDAQIKSEYEIGENFYHVSFLIHPNGEIDNVTINHHVNKAHDKKVINAIKKSEGMWTIPKLNGQKVSIVHSIQDRQSLSEKIDLLSFTAATFNDYTNEYLDSFYSIVDNMQHDRYEQALALISSVEKPNAIEPNLIYLKAKCYNKLGKKQEADKSMKLLKATKLKYLNK